MYIVVGDVPRSVMSVRCYTVRARAACLHACTSVVNPKICQGVSSRRHTGCRKGKIIHTPSVLFAEMASCKRQKVVEPGLIEINWCGPVGERGYVPRAVAAAAAAVITRTAACSNVAQAASAQA